MLRYSNHIGNDQLNNLLAKPFFLPALPSFFLPWYPVISCLICKHQCGYLTGHWWTCHVKLPTFLLNLERVSELQDCLRIFYRCFSCRFFQPEFFFGLQDSSSFFKISFSYRGIDITSWTLFWRGEREKRCQAPRWDLHRPSSNHGGDQLDQAVQIYGPGTKLSETFLPLFSSCSSHLQCLKSRSKFSPISMVPSLSTVSFLFETESISTASSSASHSLLALTDTGLMLIDDHRSLGPERRRELEHLILTDKITYR